MESKVDVAAILELTEHDQIGLVRKRCSDKGITKIGDVATAYESLRQIQVKSGSWCYENYTENGSHEAGSVVVFKDTQ